MIICGRHALLLVICRCPACRTFLPKLLAKYAQLVEQHASLLVIYVSGDKCGPSLLCLLCL